MPLQEQIQTIFKRIEFSEEYVALQLLDIILLPTLGGFKIVFRPSSEH